jgi:hypothetical protein
LEAALRGPFVRGGGAENTNAAAAAAAAGWLCLQSGTAAVSVDWAPPQPLPGAPEPVASATEAFVLRLQASDAPRLAQARGALSEALCVQLSHSVAAGGPEGGWPEGGWPEAGAALALESDRPRLQESLRRLQQLRATVAQLRGQLSEAMRLREAAGCTDAGAATTGEGMGREGAAEGAEALVDAAVRLRAGVEAAYGQALLAADDARRIVLAAGGGGAWRDC